MAQCPEGILETIYNGCKDASLLGKVSKVIFQNIADTTPGNVFTEGVNGIELKTSWDGKADAVDNTKISITGFLKEPDTIGGEPITGSENSDGAETVDGTTPGGFTATLDNPTQADVLAIKDMAKKGTLGFYFLYKNRRIRARVVSDSPKTYAPIRISEGTFNAPSPKRESTNGAPYSFMFGFRMLSDWYETSEVIEAEAGFDYNYDIAPTPV